MDVFADRELEAAAALINRECLLFHFPSAEETEAEEVVQKPSPLAVSPLLTAAVLQSERFRVAVLDKVADAVTQQELRELDAAMDTFGQRKRRLDERLEMMNKRRRLQMADLNANLNGVVREALRLLEENTRDQARIRNKSVVAL